MDVPSYDDLVQILNKEKKSFSKRKLNAFRVITAIYNARFLPARKEMQSKEQMIHFHCSIEALPRKGTDIILYS